MDWYLDGSIDASVPLLRREAMDYLHRHADPDSDFDAAELVLAEAVGNALRHADGRVWVSLTWFDPTPTLTVHDLGPGFDPGDLLAADGAEAFAESGRGLFLITHLAEEVAARSRETGMTVSARLPVTRPPSTSLDPPRHRTHALPSLDEARPEGAFGKEAFLRALVVQLAQTLELDHGPVVAEGAVAQVGTDVGGQMEAEYRAAKEVTGRLTPEQIAECYVRLKHAIDGDFVVIEASPERIVLTNSRCPFGDAVQRAPALCRMTSSVFGGIAARNTDGGAAVVLEERIAVGDPGCRVVVGLDPAATRLPHAHVYAPPAP
jgi:anti-sigma regulatory factor (Ser/Thr protein kinase)/predicted ArsR family transcriptional regulator